MMENFPPKMGTVYTNGDLLKRAKLKFLEIIELFVSCENIQCFAPVPSRPIKIVDVFIPLICVISKLPSVEMINVILLTV